MRNFRYDPINMDLRYIRANSCINSYRNIGMVGKEKGKKYTFEGI